MLVALYLHPDRDRASTPRRARRALAAARPPTRPRAQRRERRRPQRGAATARAKRAGDGAAAAAPASPWPGLLLSVCAGVLYGANFDPPTHLQARSCAHNDDCTCATGAGRTRAGAHNPLDYVFAHFCGILVASTFYFLA